MSPDSNAREETASLLRDILWILLLLIAASAAMSFWGAGSIPAGERVAIQWDAEGATSTVGRTLGLVLVPVLQALLTGLALAIPRIAPRRRHLLQSRRAYRVIWLTVMAVLTLSHGLSMLEAAGRDVPVERIVVSAVALLFVIVGNMLSKVRSNYFVGVRTPWTLSSETSWRKTHRLAGRLFVMVGIGSFLVGLFAGAAVFTLVFVIGVLTAAAAAVVYSYLVWKKEEA